MAKKQQKNPEPLSLNVVKFCPFCGKSSLVQYPQDISDKIYTCSSCNLLKFKIQMV